VPAWQNATSRQLTRTSSPYSQPPSGTFAHGAPDVGSAGGQPPPDAFKQLPSFWVGGQFASHPQTSPPEHPGPPPGQSATVQHEPTGGTSTQTVFTHSFPAPHVPSGAQQSCVGKGVTHVPGVSGPGGHSECEHGQIEAPLHVSPVMQS
jgi:hypothetical protein